MDMIKDIAALEAHYGTPVQAALCKVASRITPEYRRFIEAARFCILSTVGPEGTDATPRGDDGPVVRELDPGTLAMPDWHGNNRIDSLRNIVRDPRLSLMFMVPGSDIVIRVNGRGAVTADDVERARFERGGRLPRTVVLIDIREVYFQCARALVRSDLWRGQPADVDLPTAGDLLRAMSDGDIDGARYDAGWPQRAKESMW